MTKKVIDSSYIPCSKVKAEWPWGDKEIAKSFHVSEVESLCDWADENVILPADINRESGPWQTSRTPYNRGPIEGFLMPFVRQSTMMACTQVGKTMAHLFIPMLYTIAENPYPTALIYPNIDEAKSISETRIQKLIRSCPATACKIQSNPDDFKLQRMLLLGMTLYVLSAGVVSQAKQKQICVLIFDEIEAYDIPDASQSAEGDIIGRYRERQKGYWDIRKTLLSSSRVYVGGPIDRELAASEVVFKWHVKCPFCHEWISLSRDIFHFEDLGEGVLGRDRKARDTAHFLCDSCGNKITDNEKDGLNDTGDWLPGYIEVDPPKKDEDDNPDQYAWRPMPDVDFSEYEKKGSWTWKEYLLRNKPESIGWTNLYTSYSPWVSFGANAQEAIKVMGDFEKEKVYLKDWWCEVAKPKVKAFRSSELAELIDDREEGVVPLEAVALVCGMDNQKDRCYITVLAVNRMDFNKEQVWLVYYRELPKTGQVSADATDYSVMSDFLKTKFKRINSDIPNVPMWRAGMDTGGTKLKGSDDSMTEESYKFVRENYFRLPGGIYGTKGGSYEMHVPINKGKVKVDDTHNVYFVNTSYFKHMIARFIKEKRIHLHKGTSQEFMNHLTGEVFIRNDKGVWSWKPKSTSRRVDYLDCTVIGLAMCEEIEFVSIKNCAVTRDRSIAQTSKVDMPGTRTGVSQEQRSRVNEMQSRLRARVR